MSIQIFPYKLTEQELEARLSPGLSLLPGQLLRLEGGSPAYGQIQEVRAMPSPVAGMQEAHAIVLRILLGRPTLNPLEATLLTQEQMAREICRLQQPFEQPLAFSEAFNGELGNLKTLTLIEGDDFMRRYQIMIMLVRAIQPYQRVLILDPLGLFGPEDGLSYQQAGEQARISVNMLGHRGFLTAFGELFPTGMREAALETVAAQLSSSSGFVGFHNLLNMDTVPDALLKTLILQNYRQVEQAHVFANTPEEQLDVAALVKSGAGVLDLSMLSEPWKRVFYQAVCEAVFGLEQHDIVPVLIYPANYLSDLPEWVRRADERRMNLLMLTSPYCPEALKMLADNRFFAESAQLVALQGALSLGLPVRFALPVNETWSEEDTQAVSTLQEPPAKIPEPDDSAEEEAANPSPVPLPELFLDSRAWGEGEAPEFFDFEEPEAEPGETPEREQAPQFFNSWQHEAVQQSEDAGADAFEAEAGQPSETNYPEGPNLAEPELPEHPAVEQSYLQLEDTEAVEVLPESGNEPPLSVPEDLQEEASLSEEGLPLDDSVLDELPPLSVTVPVVDLSAPPVEAIPSFLTAEQLSELLASGAESAQEPQPQSSIEIPQAPQEAIETIDDALDYPDAEEGAIPAEPISLPSSFPQAQHPDADAEEPFFFDESLEAPAPEPHQSAEPLPTEHSQILPEYPATAPPFPSPAEFEPDEFSFDLNLDQQLESGTASWGSDTEVTPEAASRRLPEFESLALQPEEALFDFDLAPAASDTSEAFMPTQEMFEEPHAQSESQVNAKALPPSAPDTPEPTQITAQNEKAAQSELDDALDLIFPRRFDAESPAPAPTLDEPVPVLKKEPVPLPAQAGQFMAGDVVNHPTYGRGVVQKVIPMDESVVLNITFDQVGKRLLDPTLTDLSKEAG